ncbi:MAG: HipA domain-containing protein [Candidatus Delongbacteria bacterium]|jgi:serine/threonine-protein kinase HipA|nr:HipA domain-containing protein [Candidatus Delongbacteria bacterium]
MNLEKIKYCPATLAEGFDTYSSACLKKMFDGKKVSHVLSYDPPSSSEEAAELFIENRKRISISGVQTKISLILEKNILRLSRIGEHGTYILKPIPRDVKMVDQVPANEHLTMQIARQVYKIPTAENAIVFFKDGTPAYLTKRFDVKTDGSKLGKEDFASLAGKISMNAGDNYKYDFSYEEIGYLIQKYVPAWRVEIEKFFVIVIFNFLFSNGDAHLKNFALLENSEGDYLLSPFYDLLNTRLHVNDSDFALSKGLFINDFKSDKYRKSGHPTLSDFFELGEKIGVNEKRIDKLVAPFTENHELIETLIKRSFLSPKSKRTYKLHYSTKLNYLKK